MNSYRQAVDAFPDGVDVGKVIVHSILNCHLMDCSQKLATPIIAFHILMLLHNVRTGCKDWLPSNALGLSPADSRLRCFAGGGQSERVSL